MSRSRHRASAAECLTLGLVLLLGCPVEDPLRTEVSGTVLDDAGNAVRPTRVAITVDGGPDEECLSSFGWFRCPSMSFAPYTIRLERGAEVYTDTFSGQDDCDDLCRKFRPFIVETAPDGACSPDTLPRVGRLVSAAPGTIGAFEQVSRIGPGGIGQAVLPANALNGTPWVGTPDAYVEELFAEPGLPATEPLTVGVSVRANGRWCHEVGGWSGGMRLHGEALVAFLPKPGSTPCSYDPVEIHVEPYDIIDCSNISE
jgi:hypothetical protein